MSENGIGNPEVVENEENGLLVDPERWEELRDAVARLLGDPELGERFVAAGLARRHLFTREGTFSEVERVLLKVAGQTDAERESV